MTKTQAIREGRAERRKAREERKLRKETKRLLKHPGGPAERRVCSCGCGKLFSPKFETSYTRAVCMVRKFYKLIGKDVPTEELLKAESSDLTEGERTVKVVREKKKSPEKNVKAKKESTDLIELAGTFEVGMRVSYRGKKIELTGKEFLISRIDKPPRYGISIETEGGSVSVSPASLTKVIQPTTTTKRR